MADPIKEPEKPSEESGKPETDAQKNANALAETSFKDTQGLVAGYKDVQSRSDRVEAENARLRESESELRQKNEELTDAIQIPGGDTEVDSNNGVVDEFITKKEAEKMADDRYEQKKEIDRTEQKQQAFETKAKENVIQAKRLPEWGKNQHKINQIMQDNPTIYNPSVDNPLVLANRIIEEGLEDIYAKHPDFFSLDSGGLEVARTYKNLPKDIADAKAKVELEQISRDQAEVGSSYSAPVEGERAPSEMSQDELDAEVGFDRSAAKNEY